MITIDIVVRNNKGEMCGRQIEVEFANANIKALADALANATKYCVNDLDKILNLEKISNLLHADLE